MGHSQHTTNLVACATKFTAWQRVQHSDDNYFVYHQPEAWEICDTGWYVVDETEYYYGVRVINEQTVRCSLTWDDEANDCSIEQFKSWYYSTWQEEQSHVFLAVLLALFVIAAIPSAAAPLVGPCAAGAAYDPACDVNHDGTINIYDIQLTAGHWAQTGAYNIYPAMLPKTGQTTCSDINGTVMPCAG